MRARIKALRTISCMKEESFVFLHCAQLVTQPFNLEGHIQDIVATGTYDVPPMVLQEVEDDGFCRVL